MTIRIHDPGGDEPIHASREPLDWHSFVLPIIFAIVATALAIGILIIAAFTAPAFKHRAPEMPPMQLGFYPALSDDSGAGTAGQLPPRSRPVRDATSRLASAAFATPDGAVFSAGEG